MDHSKSPDWQQAVQYCEEKAHSAGTDLDPWIPHVHSPRREWWLALTVYRQALHQQVRALTDPTVAMKTWAFWYEETQRMMVRQATHPATRVLQMGLDDAGLDPVCWERFLMAVREDLSGRLIPDWEGWDRYTQYMGGSMALLAAQILGVQGDCQFAQKWGQFIYGVQLIRDVGADLRRGVVTMPQSVLEAAGVDEATLESVIRPGSDRSCWAAVWDACYQHIAAGYQQAQSQWQQLERTDQQRLIPLVMQGAVAGELLDVLRQDQFPIWEQQVRLTPFRRYWVAYRTYYFTRWTGRLPRGPVSTQVGVSGV